MIQIVFDMDGVIFDTEALCQKAWRTVGEERGISIAEIDELLKLCIGSNQQHMTEVLREKLGVDFPVQCFLSEAAEQIQLLANEHLPLKKGAEELLKWLKEQKAAVGLASSTASPIVKKYLEKAGLTEYFQIIIGGDQVIHSKPDGEIYQKACAALGTDPLQTYGVEDSYNGVRSASNAGLKTIMVPDLLPPTEEMRERACTVQPDLLAVKEYLRKEQKKSE
jgi:HAD superfamily hydrolase (TIGR01509 family)